MQTMRMTAARSMKESSSFSRCDGLQPTICFFVAVCWNGSVFIPFSVSLLGWTSTVGLDSFLLLVVVVILSSLTVVFTVLVVVFYPAASLFCSYSVSFLLFVLFFVTFSSTLSLSLVASAFVPYTVSFLLLPSSFCFPSGSSFGLKAAGW